MHKSAALCSLHSYSFTIDLNSRKLPQFCCCHQFFTDKVFFSVNVKYNYSLKTFFSKILSLFYLWNKLELVDVPRIAPKAVQNMGWVSDRVKNNLNSQPIMSVKNRTIWTQPKITRFY